MDLLLGKVLSYDAATEHDVISFPCRSVENAHIT